MVLAGYLVFVGGVWLGLYLPTLRLISLGLAGSVIAVWAWQCWRDPSWRPRSVLLPAIAACLACLAISTAFSRLPLISVEYLGYALVLAALYLLLVKLMAATFFQQRFVVLAVALFLSISGLYLTFNLSHWLQWWQVLGRLAVPPLRPQFEALVYSNPVGVVVMVALLAVPIIASRAPTRRGLAASVGVLVITTVVALVSGSRAAWLAIAMSATLGLLLAVLGRQGRARLRSYLTETSGLERVGITFLTLALLSGALLFAPPIVARATAGGETNRFAFLAASATLFTESPLVGSGPGTWAIERERATAEDLVEDVAPHAHNLYAQTIAELGVGGVVAGGILILALLWLLRNAIRDRDEARRKWGWATLLGLVFFASLQLLDNYAGIPATLFVAAIPIAYLDATERHDPLFLVRSVPRELGAKALGGAFALLAAVIVVIGVHELPALKNEQAVALANAGDWAGADRLARDVAAEDPRISAYLFTAGLTAAHSGDHETAAAYFGEVARRDDLSEAWLNLATEQMLLGQHDEVVPSIRRALRLGIQRASIAVAAGDLALRSGDRELAVSALTSAVSSFPSLIADPWWATTPERMSARDEVVGRVMSNGPMGSRWEVALMLGDVAGARSLASGVGLEPSTSDFIDAWTGDTEAAARLAARCFAEPLDVTQLQWCARIEARNGHVDRANELRYLANANFAAAAELRVATDPIIGRSLEGSQATFWGVYAYRRWQPWDMLVPSLVHLELR